MSRRHIQVNRFGFAEYDDMIEISGTEDISELARLLGAIVDVVLGAEPDAVDSLTDEAQANFAVPLGTAAKMLSAKDFSAIELVSAACTVRYCAEPHMSEFPAGLVYMLSRLPR